MTATSPLNMVSAVSDQVKRSLLNEGLLNPGAHVVLGFSGGLDSTVLLHVLNAFKAHYPGWQLTAVTVDHGWRQRPAPELPHIMGCCQAWGIPLVWVSVPANQPKTEQKARDQRYESFQQIAEQLGADAVLTAHHADDQVETVLFRLCRGTGISGLMGMYPVRPLSADSTIRLCRPLLPFTRKQLEEYASSHNLIGFMDPTNTDPTYARNALRHQVLPLLRQHFPQVDSALFRLTRLAEDAVTLLDYQLDAVWPLVVPEETVLKLQPFCQLSPALQRPLLRRFLADYEPDLSLEQTDHLLMSLLDERDEDGALFSLGTDPNTGRPRFVSLYKGDVTVRVQPDPRPCQFKLLLDEPFGVSRVDGKCTVSVEPVADKKTYWVDNSWRVLVSLKPFKHLDVVWRTREPGDRIHPEGHQHTHKLKEYLMDQNIHRFDRDSLMMLACGRNILWIPGLVRSEDVVPKGEHPTHYLTAWCDDPLFDYQPVENP